MIRRLGRAGCVCGTFLLLVLPLLLAGCNRIEALRPRTPDVLLVTIDTLRADHVGSHGAAGVATPTLDALAARGTRFDRAMAVAPLTLPSHISILTGLLPPSHGVRHNAIHRLPREVETLAERFDAAGYRTGAFVGAAVLDAAFGLDQGFDHYDAAMGEGASGPAGYAERSAEAVTDAALDWLAGRTGAPTFLWVHYYDVHARYEPPEPYRTRFVERPYDGEVAYVDAEVGRLFAAVERTGRMGETLVAVTSDHGEGLGAHGESSHSYFVYDTVLHVPLLLAGPGVPAGRVVEEVVSNAGLAPTLLALAGVAGFASVDVVALTPHLEEAADAEGATAPPAVAYAETLAGRLDHGWAPLHAVRTGDHHYIRAPRPELYDTREDPGQLVNLLPGAEGEAARAVAHAESYLTQVLSGDRSADTRAIDADTRARIESLGYVVPRGEVAGNGADPKDVHALGELVVEVMELDATGRLAEARSLALRGLEEMPDSASLNDLMARLAVRERRFADALPYAERAAALQPDGPELHAQLGYVRLRLGDVAGAVDAFDLTLARAEDHVGAHLGRMWAARIGASPEATAHHAERALELSEGAPRVVEEVVEVWERLGSYERAEAALEAGVARHPGDGRLQMRMAIQALRRGDDAEAAARRARAGTAAMDVELRNRVGLILAARGLRGEAEAVFEGILASHPEREDTRLLLARLRSQVSEGD
jgi:arylsulfatase A-like enzyme/tetratricopeptide (TPR) repeat protein